jgi:hypothetical protein
MLSFKDRASQKSEEAASILATSSVHTIKHEDEWKAAGSEWLTAAAKPGWSKGWGKWGK